MTDPGAARRPPLITESALVTALPPFARYILRGDATAMARAAQALGLSDPHSACRASTLGDRAWLWLGPDERLVLGSEQDAMALRGALQEALQPLPHSLVDVGHRQTALQVSGPDASMLLACGCPLDLHPDHCPVGFCTRTVLAKAEIVLWRTAALTFHLEVARSFAPYLSQFLAEAARELAC